MIYKTLEKDDYTNIVLLGLDFWRLLLDRFQHGIRNVSAFVCR